MELANEQPITEYFQICGEALVNHDHTMFALNCCFCMVVFTELEKFQQHILEIHLNELAEGFAVNVPDSGHVEECAEISVEDCTEDVGLFIAEECTDVAMDTMQHNEAVEKNENESIGLEEIECVNNAQNEEHFNGDTVDALEMDVRPEAPTFEVIDIRNVSLTPPQCSDAVNLENSSHVECCHAADQTSRRQSKRVNIKEKKFLDSLTDKLQAYPALWNSNDPKYAYKEQQKKYTQKLIKLMQNEYPKRIIRPKYIAQHISSIRNGLFEASRYPKSDAESFETIEQQTENVTTSAIAAYEPSCSSDLHLLQLYEQQPRLWNLQHSKFSDKAARRLAYGHIITKLKRFMHVSERSQLNVNKLRISIAQLCDWYKSQLRSKFRCKILGKAFELNQYEPLFKQFEFLQTTFEPLIQKEAEFKVRDELEAQYLQPDEIFPIKDNYSKSIAESSDKLSCQADSDVEDQAAAKETTLGSISCTTTITQERIETTRLIETYRKFPILWNPHVTKANPFKAKRKAFENIAKVLTNEYLMPMSSELVRHKIKNLRQQYKDYLKKKANGINSKLWYIPLLATFLKEHINSSLRRGNAKELVNKIPPSLDLPFRYEKNMPLNLYLIEVLHNSSSIWQSKNLTFQVSTDLLQNQAFSEMLQELNEAHGFKLDENNLLFLLHNLCEWFKREQARQQYCNEQEEQGARPTFVPSSVACWEKMQFFANYTFLPEVYTCDVCNRTTNSIYGYLIDRCSHASLQAHKCFFCDKRFLDVTNRRTHECRIHSKIFNYACEYCDKKFAHATDELIHRRRFHTQERPFVCEICGKSFVASYDMNRHRSWHLQKQDFKCKICNLNIYTRRELQLHVLRKHPSSESNKICKICGRGFATALKLKNHLLAECKQKDKRLTIELYEHQGQTRNYTPDVETGDKHHLVEAKVSLVNPNNVESSSSSVISLNLSIQ